MTIYTAPNGQRFRIEAFEDAAGGWIHKIHFECSGVVNGEFLEGTPFVHGLTIGATKAEAIDAGRVHAELMLAESSPLPKLNI